MGALTSALLFVLLCFKAMPSGASSWTATIPSSVKGLVGSCVVIPCSYNYPDPGKTVSQFTGIWMDQTNHVIYHSDPSKTVQEYKTRTELVGDITRKDCSLKIDPLQQSDQGPFHFRIEIEDYEKYSYKENHVSITIISESHPSLSVTQEVVEGHNVTASCSVSHSCPSSPPEFTWSHAGVTHLETRQLNDGQWNLTSTLTFVSTRDDHNKPVKCTVTYKGGLKGEKASSVIKVKFPPEIKTISCSSEGDDVRCVCIVESRPPSTVHFVLIDRVLPSTSTDVHGLATIGTLQAQSGSSESVRCVANNALGHVNAIFTLPSKDKKQNVLTFFIIGAGLSLVVILIAVVVARKCRGRREAVAMSQMSDAHEEKAVELPHAKSIEMDYDDVHPPGIYSNDHIYGNTESDEDEAIYANISE
ncbi:myelin-associated glycoprotein-like isoform X3 [Betta splendens]|uniref:Myelin-associated glycoprotein-like isoform X3 n=1 Tax=Betta splendens TaxID=158456 RepID=A0A6P7KTB8_BETSP|nr:myelin-associated glycoprotein-like isoform X3 [Betta splendens]